MPDEDELDFTHGQAAVQTVARPVTTPGTRCHGYRHACACCAQVRKDDLEAQFEAIESLSQRVRELTREIRSQRAPQD